MSRRPSLRTCRRRRSSSIERLLSDIRRTGRCVVVTDLDEMLTAFSGDSSEEDTIDVLRDYLAPEGSWCSAPTPPSIGSYVRLLRPLIVELGSNAGLLSQLLFIFQVAARSSCSRTARIDSSRARRAAAGRGFDSM